MTQNKAAAPRRAATTTTTTTTNTTTTTTRAGAATSTRTEMTTTSTTTSTSPCHKHNNTTGTTKTKTLPMKRQLEEKKEIPKSVKLGDEHTKEKSTMCSQNHNSQQQQQQQQQQEGQVQVESNATVTHVDGNSHNHNNRNSNSHNHSHSQNTNNHSSTTSTGTASTTSRTMSRASTPSSIGSCASNASAPSSPVSASASTSASASGTASGTASASVSSANETTTKTTTTTEAETAATAAAVTALDRRNIPAESLLPSYLSGFVQHSHEDFFVSPFFDPQLIAQLMCEGFLPIATSRYLLPKLHKERCVIHPLQQPQQQNQQQKAKSIIHTSKSTKKKLKRFTFSINQDIDGVVKGCHEQHGVAWLYPQIVSSFKHIHDLTKTKTATTTTSTSTSTSTATTTTRRQEVQQQQRHDHENENENKEEQNEEDQPKQQQQQQQQMRQGRGVVASLMDDDNTNNDSPSICEVKLYSIEVWNAQTGALAGGELGYTIGTIYTSLTGFSCEDSAGSVQLATLGKILCLSGFEMWDLGMGLDYKTNLGAKPMERIDFVDCVKEMRVKSPFDFRRSTGASASASGVELICDERMNCKEIYDMEEWTL